MAGFIKPGFVASIITDNQPNREVGEGGMRTCRIPFGTEYKVRLKNTTQLRAYAKVEIDGMAAHTGQFVLAAGETLDLERFSIDGDLASGRKFKFDKVTASGVQDPTSQDNGRVRVTFYPESDLSPLVCLATELGRKSGADSGGVLRGMTLGTSQPYYTYTNNADTGGPLFATNASSRSIESVSNNFISATSAAPPKAEMAGATVEGGISNQQFVTSHESFATTTPVVIDIMIRGVQDDAIRSEALGKKLMAAVESHGGRAGNPFIGLKLTDEERRLLAEAGIV